MLFHFQKSLQLVKLKCLRSSRQENDKVRNGTNFLSPTLEKSWKRMVTKVTFVGEGFTRKPPKYERFIRPMALRFKRANVTHPELKSTFQLDILGVKKNPQSPTYTQLVCCILFVVVIS